MNADDVRRNAWAMPLTSPSYPRGPYRFVGREFLVVSYRTDPDALAVPLTYLAEAHLAPPGLRPRALPERYVEMHRLPPEAVNHRAALGALPPLVKGYLRLGGWVGAGAVIDHQFNTTDVCVVVKTDQVTKRYFSHYERKRRDEIS